MPQEAGSSLQGDCDSLLERKVLRMHSEFPMVLS
jgi:hypothetical protein